eukprot:gene1378-2652_t
MESKDAEHILQAYTINQQLKCSANINELKDTHDGIQVLQSMDKDYISIRNNKASIDFNNIIKFELFVPLFQVQCCRMFLNKAIFLTITSLLHSTVAFSYKAQSFRAKSSHSFQLKSSVTNVQAKDVDFSWERQWYAVHTIADVPVNIPTKVTVLEKDYVIWRHGHDNKFSAYVDLCPHRLAPLSEGRIETKRNTLQCSYHGWEFNDQGKCTKIPQLGNTTSDPAVSSPRACLTPVPLSVRQGLIFLWPDVSPDGRLVASMTEPRLCENLENKKLLTLVRDLPYGYDTLAENVLDPAHVPFAHHGIQGNRDRPYMIDSIPVAIDDNSFISQGNRTIKENFKISVKTSFLAPTLIAYEFTVLMKMTFTRFLVTHITPVSPGKSRILVQVLPGKLLKMFRWIDHLERNEVLEGDLIFLHKQERVLRQMQSNVGTMRTNPSTAPFFTPARADAFIQTARSWLRRVGQPSWALSGAEAQLPLEEMSRERLLDRMNQHTKLCLACSGAYKNIKRTVKALNLMSLSVPLLLLAGSMTTTPTSTVLFTSRTLLQAALSAPLLKLLAMFLDRFARRRFEFKDYVHAYR